jgi:hypothetical protein
VAHIIKNPALPDYFLSLPGISRKTPLEKIPSVVHEYEDAKVLIFPKLRLNIDHDFWATLPTEEFPALGKMVCTIAEDDQDSHIRRLMRKYDVPADMRPKLFKNVEPSEAGDTDLLPAVCRLHLFDPARDVAACRRPQRESPF